MIAIVFLILAFVASFAVFHLAKRHLKTPTPANVVGAVFVWFAVFFVGGAYVKLVSPLGPVVEDVQELTIMAYVSALKCLGLAVLAYAGAYLLQQRLARKAGQGATAGGHEQR